MITLDFDNDYLNFFGVILIDAIAKGIAALGIWAFWNWLAWNVFNAPQMSYWIACAAVISFEWFFKLFKKGK